LIAVKVEARLQQV